MRDKSLGKKAGGTGVPPVLSFKITRRNLPHLQEPGAVYFITWPTKEGFLLDQEARTIALEAIKYWGNSKWKIYAALVMPDHVHILARPLASPEGGVFDLAEILHSVKSYSVHEINRRLGRTGPIWQDERFDRVVRDEGEFLEKWQYIRDNPVKAGLAERPEDYPWLYEGGG